MALPAHKLYNRPWVVIDATNNRMASINLRSDASKQLYDKGFLKVT